jgi:quinoprotein glucose dehydrogenase
MKDVFERKPQTRKALGGLFCGLSEVPVQASPSGAHAGDLRSHHYSPLAQVTAANCARPWSPGASRPTASARAPSSLEGTPLVAGGVLYTTGARDARSSRSTPSAASCAGCMPNAGAGGGIAPPAVRRGVAYWTDGRDERILYHHRLPSRRPRRRTGARILLRPTASSITKDDVVFGKGQQIDREAGRSGCTRRRRSRDGVVVIDAAMLEGGTPRRTTTPRGCG